MHRHGGSRWLLDGLCPSLKSGEGGCGDYGGPREPPWEGRWPGHSQGCDRGRTCGGVLGEEWLRAVLLASFL